MTNKRDRHLTTLNKDVRVHCECDVLNIACNKCRVQGSELTADLFFNIGCNKRQVQGSVLFELCLQI